MNDKMLKIAKSLYLEEKIARQLFAEFNLDDIVSELQTNNFRNVKSIKDLFSVFADNKSNLNLDHFIVKKGNTFEVFRVKNVGQIDENNSKKFNDVKQVIRFLTALTAGWAGSTKNSLNNKLLKLYEVLVDKEYHGNDKLQILENWKNDFEVTIEQIIHDYDIHDFNDNLKDSLEQYKVKVIKKFDDLIKKQQDVKDGKSNKSRTILDIMTDFRKSTDVSALIRYAKYSKKDSTGNQFIHDKIGVTRDTLISYSRLIDYLKSNNGEEFKQLLKLLQNSDTETEYITGINKLKVLPEKDFNISKDIGVQDSLTKLYAFLNFINLKTNSYGLKQWEALKNSYIKHVLLNGTDLQNSDATPLKDFQLLVDCIESQGFRQAIIDEDKNYFKLFGLDDDVAENIKQTSKNRITTQSVLTDWIYGTKLHKDLKNYFFIKLKEIND